LIEPQLGEIYVELRLMARHRRDLVEKNAALRNQIHVELDALLPGLSAALGNILDHEPALAIARHAGSAQEIRALGIGGLAKLLDAQRVGYQRRSLEKILAWTVDALETCTCRMSHKRIFADLDDERRTRVQSIQRLERDLASLLVQTPYVLLLSFPGINVVSAGEFAGEMGPIENYPSDGAITGRAGLFPSRYQSDRVDHDDGPLVRRANHSLRYVILLIADNLLVCNRYFRGLGQRWQTDGVDPRVRCVRVAKRFCRIAYQMVAGRQVFRHPSCQQRHKILDKLSKFHIAHGTTIDHVLRDLGAAAEWIPAAEHAAEAEPLKAAVRFTTGDNPSTAKAKLQRAAQAQASGRRRSGPRLMSDILPEVLLRLGVKMIESSPKGEDDLT